MANVLIVVYLLIVLALIAVILLQRSEGGGLGMGTAGSNGLISVRGSANLLTRTTGILAALFFATAIGLTVLSEMTHTTSDILSKTVPTDGAGNQTTPAAKPTNVLDALKQMSGETPATAPVTPTTPATTDTAPAASTEATPEATPAATTPAATDAAPAAATTPAPADTTTPAATAPATTDTPAAPAN